MYASPFINWDLWVDLNLMATCSWLLWFLEPNQQKCIVTWLKLRIKFWRFIPQIISWYKRDATPHTHVRIRNDLFSNLRKITVCPAAYPYYNDYEHDRKRWLKWKSKDSTGRNMLCMIVMNDTFMRGIIPILQEIKIAKFVSDILPAVHLWGLLTSFSQSR